MSDMERYGAALGQIIELSVLLNEDMAQSLGRDGLTTSRAHLMWELHHRGPSTQRVLAEAMNVSARNITGLVDALTATGFVTREPHPTDRRATLVSFTEHGARIAAAMEADQKTFAGLLFGTMPAERFACLVKGLDVILAQLRAHITMPSKGEDQ